MKRSTRMMLMSSGNNRRYNDGRSYDNYDVDDKFRDRRGREHYDNGRYAPRSEMMEPEDRGYRRYSDGRFAPRNDGGMWVESRYWDDRMYGPQSHYGYPYVPPVYREDGSAYTERREIFQSTHPARGATWLSKPYTASLHEQNRIRYLWRR